MLTFIEEYLPCREVSSESFDAAWLRVIFHSAESLRFEWFDVKSNIPDPHFAFNPRLIHRRESDLFYPDYPGPPLDNELEERVYELRWRHRPLDGLKHEHPCLIVTSCDHDSTLAVDSWINQDDTIKVHYVVA